MFFFSDFSKRFQYLVTCQRASNKTLALDRQSIVLSSRPDHEGEKTTKLSRFRKTQEKRIQEEIQRLTRILACVIGQYFDVQPVGIHMCVFQVTREMSWLFFLPRSSKTALRSLLFRPKANLFKTRGAFCGWSSQLFLKIFEYFLLNSGWKNRVIFNDHFRALPDRWDLYQLNITVLQLRPISEQSKVAVIQTYLNKSQKCQNVSLLNFYPLRILFHWITALRGGRL